MPHPEANNETRQLLLAELSRIVHADFDCDGAGSIFCLGCQAVRAVHVLQEVYEEIDDDAVSETTEESVDLFPGIPSLPSAELHPDSQAKPLTIGELDDIAQKIIDQHNKDDDDTLSSDNLVLN